MTAIHACTMAHMHNTIWLTTWILIQQQINFSHASANNSTVSSNVTQAARNETFQERIWNGDFSCWQRYPFFVWLHYEKTRWFSAPDFSGCSGAMIAEGIALTAAHCMKNYTQWIDMGGTAFIWTRVSNIHFKGGIKAKIIKYYTHPEYRGKHRNVDMALIHFDVSDLGNWRPSKYLKLPHPGDEKKYIDQPKDVTLLGMGQSVRTLEAHNFLKETQIRLQDKTCPYPLSYSVCFDVAETKICPGDSGGPIFAVEQRGQVAIAVITSARYQCMKLPDPFVLGLTYADRVSSEMGWILKTIVSILKHHHMDQLIKEWEAALNIPILGK